MQRDLVSCPYNPSHKMPKERLQWHVTKCSSKAHVGQNYATCPYNSHHIVLKSELSHHSAHCKDKQKQRASGNEADELDLEMKRYVQTSLSAEEDAPVGWADETSKGMTKSQQRNMKRREARKKYSTHQDQLSDQPFFETAEAQPEPDEPKGTAQEDDGWTTVPSKKTSSHGGRGEMVNSPPRVRPAGRGRR